MQRTPREQQVQIRGDVGIISVHPNIIRNPVWQPAAQDLKEKTQGEARAVPRAWT